MDWYPLWNSLRIALISCAAVFFLGSFFRLYIAKLPRTVKGVLDVVLTLPMVLPPTVVGYFLLLLFGAKRPLGIILHGGIFGVKLVMNWYSAIFASIVVAFPLMYRTARGAFESFDETLAWSAQTLGQSNAWIFWRVRMPCCRQGILAGTVLAFARALGEYGATSMIAGYTPGKTATIATTVYQLWRTNDEAGAMRWVLVDIVISAVVLLAVNLLEKKAESRWPRMSLEVHIEKKLNGFTLRSDFTAGNTATAILGASGCGKSMTLRCIAGIVKPDKGRIVLDGRVLFDSEQHIDLPPQQRGVGLLFQNYALFPNMTVEQNILCGLKAERDNAARKARCAGMLRALRLEELASRRPAELSGGQQQRTALARILVGKPKILMLDEPFSALDSYLREEVEGEVGSLLAGFAGTALLVTHNRDEAYRLCRDMIVMDGGQVLRTGTTKEVFADPRSTAAARLTGCKNILPCTRVDAHSVRLAGCESPAAPRRCRCRRACTAVGIRAHDFAPCAPGAENALPVELLSASENPFDWNLIFQLPDGTTRLWWQSEQDDPLRGRTRRPGLPLRPAGEHHGAGGS